MKTGTKNLIKRTLALTLAFTVTMAAFTNAESVLSSDNAVSAQSSEAKENEKKIDSTEDELAALEKKQEELDKKIKDTAGDISSEEENQQAISEQIDTVEKTLRTLASSIGELETSIADMEKSIIAKEGEVEQKKQEIMTGIEDFKKRLRVMYIAGNDSYTDILVGASDFYDMLMKLELVKRVANHDNDMIDDLISLKEQYEAEEAELNEQKAKLEADRDELESRREKQQAQMKKLEELYSESEQNLKDLEADRALYENNLAEIEKQHAEFEDDLAKLFEERETIKKEEEERKRKEEEERKKKEEEERKRQEEAERQQQENNSNNSSTANNTDNNNNNNNTNNSNNSENQNNNSNNNNNNNNNPGGGNTNADYGYVDKSRFTWPVPGFYHISYGVGWRWGAYHKGIDIYSPNIRGANIIAADAGEVILVSNTCTHDYGKDYSCGCGGGYGNYCIIDHGDGYWTLYGHSERMIVTQGQHVEKGTILGTVGSTGHSTGPHLHFEVRINNVAQNPSDFV